MSDARQYVTVLMFVMLFFFCTQSLAAPGGLDLRAERVERYFVSGLKAFEDGDYQAAEEWFERLVLIAPDQVMGNVLLGRARFRLGKLEQAIFAFQRALERKPGDARALTYLGEVYEIVREYEKAFQAYAQIDMDDLSEEEKETLQYRINALNHRVSSALARYEKARELIEQDTTEKRFQDALRLLNQAESLVPRIDGIQAAFGEVFYQMERYSDAIIRFRSSLVTDGEDENTLLRLAMSFDSLGLPVEAYEHVLRWREVTGEINELREVQERLKKLAEEEKKRFRQSSFQDQLGRVYFMYSNNLFEEAIRWSERIDDSQEDLQSRMRLNYLKTVVYNRAMLPQKTVELTEKVMDLVDNRQQVEEIGVKLVSDQLEMRGRALMMMNRNEEARAALDIARRTYPENLTVFLALVELDEKIGNTDEAQKLLQEMTKLFPGNPEVLYRLGLSKLDKGDVREAVEAFKKFLQHEPDTARAALARRLIEDMEGKAPGTGPDAAASDVDGAESARDDKRPERPAGGITFGGGKGD